MREYYLHKGGEGSDRLTALREMAAFDAGLRRAALCELSEMIAEGVKHLARETSLGTRQRSGFLQRSVIQTIVGDSATETEDLRKRLEARKLGQVELLELLIAVQLCIVLMPQSQPISLFPSKAA
jgi:hypothetical protein